jgi:hypothetical protein
MLFITLTNREFDIRMIFRVGMSNDKVILIDLARYFEERIGLFGLANRLPALNPVTN